MIKKEFLEKIRSDEIEIYEDEPMSQHTSFRIGGKADCFCVVKESDVLKKVLSVCKEENVPFFIIGMGSNILVSDEGIEGVVIKLSGEFDEIEKVGENQIRCGAGATLAAACNFAKNNSLGGLEFAWGIPGSIGGAVYMNAGAYGGEIKDVVVSTRYIDENGVIKELNGKSHNFTYRGSYFTNRNCVILDTTIELSPKNKNEIFYLMQDTMQKRKSKQPLNRPSAGSVFKRPEGGVYAAALIEQCGLKGVSIGDAQVSEKHSGFIVNNGEASAKDVKELIEKIKVTVKEKTGIELKCEVKYIGK